MVHPDPIHHFSGVMAYWSDGVMVKESYRWKGGWLRQPCKPAMNAFYSFAILQYSKNLIKQHLNGSSVIIHPIQPF
jgi:hypothetical protein